MDVESVAVQEQLGALSAKVQENLTGMPVVRAYTMESREIDAFGRLNAEYLARSLRLARTQAALIHHGWLTERVRRNMRDLQAAVKQSGAQVGIAYDGDADRNARLRVRLS